MARQGRGRTAHKDQRIQLILDFDGTITKSDTTAIIGNKCFGRAQDLTANYSTTKAPDSMEYYSNKYMEEFREWKESNINSCPVEKRKTIQDEVSYLSQARDVEVRSLMRVRQALRDVAGDITTASVSEFGKNLQNVSSNDARNEDWKDAFVKDEFFANDFLSNAGRQALRNGEVQIRDLPGLKGLIGRVDIWGIVSVSWSRHFILGVLTEAGLLKGEEVEKVAADIKCNELLASTSSEDAGLNLICSAQDKLNAFQSLLQEWELREGNDSFGPVESTEEHGTITIYVGDSSTDLGCLCNATVGMFMRDCSPKDNGMLEIMDRLRVESYDMDRLPISGVSSELKDVKKDLEKNGFLPHVICGVQNFEQIDDWLARVEDGDYLENLADKNTEINSKADQSIPIGKGKEPGRRSASNSEDDPVR